MKGSTLKFPLLHAKIYADICPQTSPDLGMGPIIQSQKVCLHSVRTKTHMLSQVSHVYDVLTTAPARACTKFLWENNILSVTGRSNAGKIGTISLKLTVLENKVIFAHKICLQLNIHSKNLFRRLRNGE